MLQATKLGLNHVEPWPTTRAGASDSSILPESVESPTLGTPELTGAGWVSSHITCWYVFKKRGYMYIYILYIYIYIYACTIYIIIHINVCIYISPKWLLNRENWGKWSQWDFGVLYLQTNPCVCLVSPERVQMANKAAQEKEQPETLGRRLFVPCLKNWWQLRCFHSHA